MTEIIKGWGHIEDIVSYVVCFEDKSGEEDIVKFDTLEKAEEFASNPKWLWATISANGKNNEYIACKTPEYVNGVRYSYEERIERRTRK